ncbi:DUF1593 domain-containing protein [Brevundimonas sp. NPDC092305]|uniref:DUF1593 domain-containing protein n=1 Tax=Brevundimonas sp. NPDC092305 TaxID=3363957 RepID=UPI00381CE733
MRTRLAAILSLLLSLNAMAASAAVGSDDPRSRVIVSTDIGGDPDDQESMVRFLLYANEFDVEGLIASSSRHLRTGIQPQQITQRIDAYGEVLPNLRTHAEGYPDAGFLRDRVKSGSGDFGMAGVGEGRDTEGSRWIIEVVDRPDPRPVYVLLWGGAVHLAQALHTVRATRSEAEVAAFAGKLRVYSISDQDNAGPWVRRFFPDIFWITSIHAHRHYNLSTWGGMSGDQFYYFEGPDFDLVSRQWARDNVRKGPLGLLYPLPEFIMEGDSPSFLYLIPNGLGSPEHPDYGSWGGRFGKVSEWDGLWADTSDYVVDGRGRIHQDNKATIWRWREAFQNDFAARIQWTLHEYRRGANHNPEPVLNGIEGRAPVELTVRPGERVALSAEGSADPDGDGTPIAGGSIASPRR